MKHNAETKFAAVVAVLRGHKTTQEVCAEYTVDEGTFNSWKEALLAKLPNIFADEQKTEALTEFELAAAQSPRGLITPWFDWIGRRWIHIHNPYNRDQV
jgi:transposase-like protein